MSTNMELITSVTVGSGGAASVTLPATGTIPQTYTDLKIVASIRATSGGTMNAKLGFNGSTSGYSERLLYGTGSTASSTSASTTSIQWATLVNGATSTANTFSNCEIYIPNYTSSNFKSVSTDSVQENNTTAAEIYLDAGLWSNTAAITTIDLNASSSSFAEGSTFYLYGISNVTSTTKATGGIVSSDGTYNYHMFPYSGTFTPTQAISADVLVIAGGGGGSAAGGGAGGLRYFSSQSLSATGYTCTVGGGGTFGGSGASNGTNGTDSQFAALTISTGGGGGAFYGAQNETKNGVAGGSGGGGSSRDSTGTGTGGAASPSGQGNAGGNGLDSSAGAVNGGGGGGAGAVGGNTAFNSGGNGGDGVNTYSSWAAATQTGADNGYYAGGGRGQSNFGSSLGRNGLGNGTANTGGGGMSASSGGGNGFAGQSGIIIIRYAI